MSARGLVPHPAWSACFAFAWLALADSLWVGHVLLAVALGLAIPLALRRSWPARPRFRRPLLAFVRSVAFGGLVLADVVVANLQVARAVLGPVRRLRPAFVVVPLDLEDERAMAVLAHAVTLTPGTLSVAVDPARRELHVHALHAPDAAALVREIKARYERRVAEIWSC